MRSFRTSSYVAPPTLYERRRAQVSLFTGIVVVGMTINIIRLIVLIVVARRCKSVPLPDRRTALTLVVRPDAPPGLPNVRNYDGAWTEWGNLVRTPIENP